MNGIAESAENGKIKIVKRYGMWSVSAPIGSGLGYYANEDIARQERTWYAMGNPGGFGRACSRARCWIRDKNTDWGDPEWGEL